MAILSKDTTVGGLNVYDYLLKGASGGDQEPQAIITIGQGSGYTYNVDDYENQGDILKEISALEISGIEIHCFCNLTLTETTVPDENTYALSNCKVLDMHDHTLTYSGPENSEYGGYVKGGIFGRAALEIKNATLKKLHLYATYLTNCTIGNDITMKAYDFFAWTNVTCNTAITFYSTISHTPGEPNGWNMKNCKISNFTNIYTDTYTSTFENCKFTKSSLNGYGGTLIVKNCEFNDCTNIIEDNQGIAFNVEFINNVVKNATTFYNKNENGPQPDPTQSSTVHVRVLHNTFQNLKNFNVMKSSSMPALDIAFNYCYNDDGTDAIVDLDQAASNSYVDGNIGVTVKGGN